MIAIYYQRTFTIIQSNFGGFLHYQDIVQQKQIYYYKSILICPLLLLLYNNIIAETDIIAICFMQYKKQADRLQNPPLYSTSSNFRKVVGVSKIIINPINNPSSYIGDIAGLSYSILS